MAKQNEGKHSDTIRGMKAAGKIKFPSAMTTSSAACFQI
jgi:hypothetical protein